MKKVNFRTVVWVLLTSASLFSYLYLASLQCDEQSMSTSTNLEIMGSEKEEDQKDSKIILPDVALVKKVLNITKIVMPKD